MERELPEGVTGTCSGQAQAVTDLGFHWLHHVQQQEGATGH